MENRVAVLAILVENPESVAPVNELLHQFSEFVVGRMGLPYRQKKVNVISVVLDAPVDQMNQLAGRLGRLPGVTAKALYTAR